LQLLELERTLLEAAKQIPATRRENARAITGDASGVAIERGKEAPGRSEQQ